MSNSNIDRAHEEAFGGPWLAKLDDSRLGEEDLPTALRLYD